MKVRQIVVWSLKGVMLLSNMCFMSIRVIAIVEASLNVATLRVFRRLTRLFETLISKVLVKRRLESTRCCSRRCLLRLGLLSLLLHFMQDVNPFLSRNVRINQQLCDTLGVLLFIDRVSRRLLHGLTSRLECYVTSSNQSCMMGMFSCEGCSKMMDSTTGNVAHCHAARRDSGMNDGVA